jgi:S1-C subfamily serine protease
VILAGSGHLAFGYGIPQRVARRTGASYAIVLSSERELEPGIADYVLLGKDVSLPPAGVLGVRMEQAAGGVRIASFASDSPAEAAGLERDDVLISVDGEKIASPADVRAALWDKKPGDRVTVEAQRRHRRKTEDLTVVVVLDK